MSNCSEQHSKEAQIAKQKTTTGITYLVLFILLSVGIHPIWAQDARPDARLRFSSFSVGLLFGYSHGDGALDFAGRQYPFKVSGIKLATAGVSQADVIGQVYRLREPTDLAGRYIWVEGGLTVAQGGGGAVLRNEKGVMIYLQSVQKGLELSLGGGSFEIALTEATDAATSEQ